MDKPLVLPVRALWDQASPYRLGSRAWIYERLADGGIPSVKIGGKLVVARAAVERLIGESVEAPKTAN